MNCSFVILGKMSGATDVSHYCHLSFDNQTAQDVKHSQSPCQMALYAAPTGRKSIVPICVELLPISFIVAL
jgi:hypothetical protein